MVKLWLVDEDGNKTDKNINVSIWSLFKANVLLMLISYAIVFGFAIVLGIILLIFK